MQKGNYTTAMNKLDSLQYNFTFSAYDSIEYPYYSELKELQKDWLVAGRNIFSLTSTEIDKLVTIADSSYGIAGAQARGMLTFMDDSLYSYATCISIPDTTQKSAWVNGDSSPMNNDLEVKVMPVPADGQLIFEYVLPGDCTEGEILVYDNSGRIIKQFLVNQSGKKIIDVSGIQSGIYLFRFVAGRFNRTGKIIINH